MKKLPEVEAVKVLMQEATSWSVMKWLREKKTVRRAADRANAILDERRKEIGDQWKPELKSGYLGLSAPASSPNGISHTTLEFLRKVKEADDQAARARAEAEATFDQAERQLSTRLAREGCRKAIESWELCEKAIRTAEAAISH